MDQEFSYLDQQRKRGKLFKRNNLSLCVGSLKRNLEHLENACIVTQLNL